MIFLPVAVSIITKALETVNLLGDNLNGMGSGCVHAIRIDPNRQKQIQPEKASSRANNHLQPRVHKNPRFDGETTTEITFVTRRM
jgi:hypothetical protein